MCAPGSLGLRLLAAVLFVLLLGAGDARLEELGAQARRINSQRLQATLEKLSEFGRHPEGGVTRLGFLQADLDARTYVTSLMKDAGLEIYDGRWEHFWSTLGVRSAPYDPVRLAHRSRSPAAGISTDH